MFWIVLVVLNSNNTDSKLWTHILNYYVKKKKSMINAWGQLWIWTAVFKKLSWIFEGYERSACFIPFTKPQCSVSICPLRAVIGMAPAAVTWWEVPLMWGNTNQKWGKCHKCVMKWFNALLMHFSLQLLGRFNNNIERGQLSSSANSWDETHLHIAPLQLHKILRF